MAARLVRLVAGVAVFAAAPALAQETLESFPVRLPVAVKAAAPYYRLNVPLQAYLASARGDLGDLRVFNAAGQPVPYALLAASGSTEESMLRQKLHWFPLHGAAAGQTNEAADDSALKVVVKQARDGTLVEVNSQRNSPGKPGGVPPVRGYVLDLSHVADRPSVRAFELDWKDSGSDFQLLDVESSDDLRHWSSLVSGVQLARMDYNGARIENRRIELNGLGERYVRLVWREPVNAPVLTSVEIEQSRSHYHRAPLAWSSPMAASTSGDGLEAGEYRFVLPQPLPVARLRIELPPGNQLLPLEVLAPQRDRRYWQPLASAVAYRISSKGREWSDMEIPLSGMPLKEFVLRVDPRRNPLAQGPRVAFALQPVQVVFLASGEAPYTLAVGNKNAQDAALVPTTLIPGFGGSNSPDIAEASAGAEMMEAVPTAAPVAEPRNWKKIALWGVLLLGVAGMFLMAWQLLRQMKQSGGPLQ